MSGHSKWSTIKRKKGANDAKKSKIFSKLIKEITVAVKEGGADPEGNPRLRMAIANAKGQSMPKDNIIRAINKGKDKNSADFQEIVYEGYLSHGIAVYVECTTDNLQRTVSNVRAIFNKHGGNLATNGSLSFLFDRKGIFTFPLGGHDREALEMELIEGGAEDIEIDEDNFVQITTALEDFGNMMKKLEELKIEPETADLQRMPNTTKKLSKEEALSILKIIDLFEDDDDIQKVFHNLEFTDELIADMA